MAIEEKKNKIRLQYGNLTWVPILENSDIEKRCFMSIIFYFIELEARNFDKIMERSTLLFNINFNFISSAVLEKI